MPAGYFRIRVAEGTWLSPQNKTFPKPENGTPRIIHARPTKRSGTGKPRGAFGKPEAVANFKHCVGDAYLSGDTTLQRYSQVLSLYAALADSDESEEVEIELRDERTEAWKTYSCDVLRPTTLPVHLPDGTNWYFDVEVRFINLVASGN